MPTVITLAEAKVAIRVLDSAHDPDIQAMVIDADDAIRNRLDTRNDASWDAATAPPRVKRAALLLVGHLYEHRGDEFGDDNDERVWHAIDTLLMYVPAMA